MKICKEITVEAKAENLNKVFDFIQETLKDLDIDKRTFYNIRLCVEEIFLNVSSYAYENGDGDVTVKTEISEEFGKIYITFIDSGVPFNPVAREEFDANLPLEQRGIGGLGIHLVKNISDGLEYEYKDGCNILTIKKILTSSQ